MSETSPSQCPRCAEILEYGTYHDIELDKCPACQGVLLANRVLIPLLEAVSGELVETIDPHRALEAVDDQGGGLRCPRCGGEMEHHGYMGTNLVMVDSCGRCMMVWLDPGELAAMSLIYARTERRVTERREQMERRMREVERNVDALLAARAVQRMLVVGFRLL